MSLEVAEAIAADLLSTAATEVTLIWHGGEPLATPYTHFRKLLERFGVAQETKKARHAIQTNATLLTDAWCATLREFGVQVGVSIDGTPSGNSERVDWKGYSADDRIIRGIALLRQHNIPFGMIAVVTQRTVGNPEILLNIAKTVGARSLAVNFEEAEDAHHRTVLDDSRVLGFWKTLFEVWRQDTSKLRVREFASVLHSMYGICVPPPVEVSETPRAIDLFPTISYKGDVVLLSPELNGARSDRYNDFIVGNVLQEPLSRILKRAFTVPYVEDYLKGVGRCEGECDAFFFCRGGQASNKYFENGELDSTETAACRNSKKRLIAALIEAL
jgi:uncharacterized protein